MERRNAEARSAAEDPLLGLETSRWLGRGAPEGDTRDRLAKRLDSLRQAYPYEAVFLLDASGRILVATDPASVRSSQDRAPWAGRKASWSAVRETPSCT